MVLLAATDRQQCHFEKTTIFMLQMFFHSFMYMHSHFCFQYINSDLSQKIQSYDPTSPSEANTHPSVIEKYLKGKFCCDSLQHGIAHHYLATSQAFYFYFVLVLVFFVFVFVCLFVFVLFFLFVCSFVSFVCMRVFFFTYLQLANSLCVLLFHALAEKTLVSRHPRLDVYTGQGSQKKKKKKKRKKKEEMKKKGGEEEGG
jgi:hypothetical protein